MKKNGFTLVELLAVVVILAVIVLITTISVRSILLSSKDSLFETQKAKVEEAAQVYYLKEGIGIDATCVDISYLLEKGYLEGTSIIDPKTNEEMVGSVKITYSGNQYMYEYQENICSIQ